MVLGGKSRSFLKRRFFITTMPLLFFVASSLLVSAAAAPDCSATLVRFMPCVDYVISVSSSNSSTATSGSAGGTGIGTGIPSTGAVSVMRDQCCSAVREQLMIPAASIIGNNAGSLPPAAESDNATCVCAAMQAAAAGTGFEFGTSPSASEHVNAVDYRPYILSLPSACSLRFQQPCPPFTGPAPAPGSESNPTPPSQQQSPSPPAAQLSTSPPPPSPSMSSSAPDAPADQVPPPSSMPPNREFASAPTPPSDGSVGNPTGLGLAPSSASAPMDGIAGQQQQQSPPPISNGAFRTDSQFWTLLYVAALLVISAMANN